MAIQNTPLQLLSVVEMSWYTQIGLNSHEHRTKIIQCVIHALTIPEAVLYTYTLWVTLVQTLGSFYYHDQNASHFRWAGCPRDHAWNVVILHGKYFSLVVCVYLPLQPPASFLRQSGIYARRDIFMDFLDTLFIRFLSSVIFIVEKLSVDLSYIKFQTALRPQ